MWKLFHHWIFAICLYSTGMINADGNHFYLFAQLATIPIFNIRHIHLFRAHFYIRKNFFQSHTIIHHRNYDNQHSHPAHHTHTNAHEPI